MFVKVEPTGCCERKGMVQIRFCMYLEPSDYGYEKHYVQVPIIPEGGYPGEVDEMGNPIDIEDYNKWLDTLPKAWQTNPFHNHFIYVEPDISDEDIMDIGEAFLHEAYIKWACEQRLDPINPSVKFYLGHIDTPRWKMLHRKVQHLKDTVLERKV